jgi:hypothetical protein
MLSLLVQRGSAKTLVSKSLLAQAYHVAHVPSSFTRFAAPNVVSRAYHENIVEHYENPRNVGSFDKNDFSVGTVSFFELSG